MSLWKQRYDRRWNLLLIVCLLVSVYMTLSVKHGTAMVDSFNGYHLHPKLYLGHIAHAWDDSLFLGQDTGSAQAALFPGALAYALMDQIGIGSDIAQKLFLFAQFFVIAISIAWFVKVVAFGVTDSMPVITTAPIFYLCNLYVANDIRTSSVFLWSYAALPALMAITYLAVRERQPVRYGIVIGLTSLLMTGINGTLIVINLLVICAFLIFVALTAEDKTKIHQTVLFFGLVGFVAGIVCNAYWLFPYVHQLQTAWIGGIFSEAIEWHSEAANVPDILRLLGDPGFFGRDNAYGWYYPFAQFYLDPLPFAVLSRLLPIFALGVFLWRCARAETLLRYFGVMAILVIPMASGAHIGAWTSSIFEFLYKHYTLFQIFRGLQKWDAVIALSFSILCAYHVGIIYHWLISAERKFLAVGAAVGLGLLGAAVVLPVVLIGAFRTTDLSGIPKYWENAANLLGFASEKRVALFPKQYFPHYFWGTVGADFPSLALEHSTTYSVANGAGAPSEQSAYMVDSINEALASRADWSAPLLQRLGISDVIEQRDSFYLPDETNLSPNTQVAALMAVPQIRPWRSVGALADFRVANSMPTFSIERPFVTASSGHSLLRLLALLKPDEAAVWADNDITAASSMPGILDAANMGALAASLAPAVVKTRLEGTTIGFYLSRDENLRIFARRTPLSAAGQPFRLAIDGNLGPTSSVLDSWTLVAALRLATGYHTLASDGLDSSNGADLKIVDDNVYNAVEGRLLESPKNGLTALLNGQPVAFSIPTTERLSIRVESASLQEADYSFPLALETYGLKSNNHAWCGNLPVAAAGAAVVQNSAPPAAWYFDDRLLPFVLNGRMISSWYDRFMTVQVFNPFEYASYIDVRVNVATVGTSRRLSLRNESGLSAKQAVSLWLPHQFQIDNLSISRLRAADYLDLTGGVTPADYRVAVRPKWSTLELDSSGGDALPNIVQGGFVTFGMVWPLRAAGCGTPRISPATRAGTVALFRTMINRSTGQPSSALMTVRIPNIAIATLPRLEISANTDGAISVVGIVHFLDERNNEHTYPIQFNESQSSVETASLVPDSTVGVYNHIDRVDIVATLLSGREAFLSDPRLILSRTNVERLGQAKISGRLDTVGVRVTIPPTRDIQRSKLVLEIYAADPAHRDVALDSSAGLMIGRAIELNPAHVDPVENGLARISFRVSVSLPASAFEAWRQHIRIFADNREMRPTMAQRPLPGQFALSPTETTLLLPIGQAVSVRHWYFVYLPAEWIMQSRFVGEPEQIQIPLADGLTSLDGRRRPLSGILFARAVSSSNDVDKYQYPISVDSSYVEGIVDEPKSQPAPTIQIDGKSINLHWSEFGWFQTSVRLAAGKHEVGGPINLATTILLLPESPETHYLAQQSLSATQISAVHFRLLAPARQGTQILAFRQLFAPGWRATLPNGGPLPHIFMDGYGNAFVLAKGAGIIDLYYLPESLLQISRLISAAAILVGLIVLAIGSVWRNAVKRAGNK